MRRLESLFAAVCLCLLAIVGVELILRGLFFIYDGSLMSSEESVADPRGASPAYAGADFDPDRLWDELQQGTSTWLRYQPYTVWTRRPFTGEYVNVDPDGLRATTDNSDLPDALRIWVFGGSTTWGMGVPDAYTLPSYLARKLKRAGISARVTNFGQTGFVSTQDLLALIRSLQIRPPPDLAIFYEGANEGLGLLDAPSQLNPHYLTNRITALFENRLESDSPALTLLRKTALFRLATGIGNRIFPSTRKTAASAHLTDFGSIPDLAADGLRAYLTNQEISISLGNELGFTTVFFWQPWLGVGPKPLDQSEQAELEELKKSPKQRFLIEFGLEQGRQLSTLQQKLRIPAGPHFIDISKLFKETRIPVYLDWVHVSHRGNEMLADTMLQHLKPDICKIVTRHHPNNAPDFCDG